MAKWDLSTTIALYLDKHLVFPFLEFLSHHKIYDVKELLNVRCKLAKRTLMADFCIDLFKEMHPGEPIPMELIERRDFVMAKVKNSQKATELTRDALVKTTKNEEIKQQVLAARDERPLLDYLIKTFNFKLEWMEDIYLYAKEQYECGNYGISAQFLYFCQLLQPTMEKNNLNILWGKLASEILMQNWDIAMDDFTRLKEYIDNNNFGSSLITLQQRTWLINWSLFVFYNHPKGHDMVIDVYLYQQQYLNAIQTTCPHILRYLAAAVITNKQRPSVMKELVKVIQQESYHYRDPITEFVECLYVNFDFDGAQKKLRECEEVLKSDFFLISCLDDFIENARMVIFETFCCIHQCISITMLADKLNLTPEKAEQWIVNLIRNARLDAKIDSRLGHVVMGINTLSPYQQLIEKTKVLSFRTQLLASNLEKKVASNFPERVPYWAASEF